MLARDKETFNQYLTGLTKRIKEIANRCADHPEEIPSIARNLGGLEIVTHPARCQQSEYQFVRESPLMKYVRAVAERLMPKGVEYEIIETGCGIEIIVTAVNRVYEGYK